MTPPTSSDNEPVICLGGCGRELTSRESRARGYGSDCWRKLHRRPARGPRRPTPTTAVPTEGQDELPYDELPLWTA